MGEVMNLIEELNRKIDALVKQNEELKERLQFFNAAGNTVDKKTYNEVVNENAILKKKIEEMKLAQKTAFDKGMKHLAKELKEYDRINGAWTDYFEHTVNKVLKWELEEIGKTERELEE